LVVDDNEINLKIFEEQLSYWSMQPKLLNDPNQALNELHQQPYDLMILDHMMPELSGQELIHQVREHYPDLPILLISSVDLSLTDIQLDKDPHLKYLAKPLDYDHLKDQLLALFAEDTHHSQQERTDEDTNTAVTLPTPQDQPQPSNEQPRSNQQLPPANQPLERFSGRVLLVEDTLINQLVGQELLASFGLDVDLAEDGQKAVDKVAQHSYDLVFMDCLMPVMDGYQSTRQIRRNEAGTQRHLPICALTANALQDAKYKCQAAGMDDFISKPFKTSELVKVLNKWLPKATEQPLSSGGN
jgi:CheY-like chemotaxis protein